MCVFYEKNNMKNIIYNDKNFADKKQTKVLSPRIKMLFASLLLSCNMSMNYVVAMKWLCCKSCVKRNKTNIREVSNPQEIIEKILKHKDSVSDDVVLQSLEQTDMTQNILSCLHNVGRDNLQSIVNKIADSIYSVSKNKRRFAELLSKTFNKEFSTLAYIMEYGSCDAIKKIAEKLCKLGCKNFFQLMSQINQCLMHIMECGSNDAKTIVAQKLCKLRCKNFLQLMSQINRYKYSNLTYAMECGSNDAKTMIVKKLCNLGNDKFCGLMLQINGGHPFYSGLMRIMQNCGDNTKIKITKKLCNKDYIDDNNFITLLSQQNFYDESCIDIIMKNKDQNIIDMIKEMVNNIDNVHDEELTGKLDNIKEKIRIAEEYIQRRDEEERLRRDALRQQQHEDFDNPQDALMQFFLLLHENFGHHPLDANSGSQQMVVESVAASAA